MLIPSAHSQVMLTGAVEFSTNATGGAYGGQIWNTSGNDAAWDLWLSSNPNGSSPVNGPSDLEASVNILLEAGKSYRYYMFGAPSAMFKFAGLNLFFNGNNSTPGISVFGPVETPYFTPNNNSTETLSYAPVPGAGTAVYFYNGFAVVLTEYTWRAPGTPPGDICQAMSFTPGTAPCYYGSFSLTVLPAASLSLSQRSASPYSKITVSGSGFSPNEQIDVFAGVLQLSPVLAAAKADSQGSFSAAFLFPQQPIGVANVYAYGLTSKDLGAATLSVIPAVAVLPAISAPGDAITTSPVGFGMGEAVSIYWNNPRLLLGTVTANALGSASLAVTVPSNATPGLNGLFATGAATGALGLGKILLK